MSAVAAMSPAPNAFRFSEYFGLAKGQAELDFVDIPISTDLLLFCDPYSFVVERDPWFIEANDLIVDFFETVLGFVRSGDRDAAMRLLAHVGEVNEIHLGFSKGPPRGSGIGSEKAGDLYDKLKRSKAVSTGRLRDLADCDLFVQGIGADNVSDMTASVIRSLLLDYTAGQCRQLGIPTRRVQGGFCWDSESKQWGNRYAELPIVNGKAIILLPKASVRYQLALDHQEFYDDFVLDFLRAEHERVGDGLVNVLKNGKRKVYKKDLKEAHPHSKEFLFEFAEQNPEVLAKYKEQASKLSRPLSDLELELRQQQPKMTDYVLMAQTLTAIPPGRANATEYHHHVQGVLEAVFYPQLRFFQCEQEVNQGRKRIDIVANSSQNSGFFGDLSAMHQLKCPYVMIECKNYSDDPQNPELDQLLGRLNDLRGRVGILACRTVQNAERMQKACTDALKEDSKLILVLTDADLIRMLTMKGEGNSEGISQLMHEKLRAVTMG
jgi:hypothetical protein